MECWPRNVDITAPETKQYQGWPRTISQVDNYSPRSWGDLGTLTFNVDDPVIQLVDSSNNEVLYTLRVSGRTFTPKAPEGKSFTIKAGTNTPNQTVATKAAVGGKPQTVQIQ